jgi:hypothetical protein
MTVPNLKLLAAELVAALPPHHDGKRYSNIGAMKKPELCRAVNDLIAAAKKEQRGTPTTSTTTSPVAAVVKGKGQQRSQKQVQASTMVAVPRPSRPRPPPQVASSANAAIMVNPDDDYESQRWGVEDAKRQIASFLREALVPEYRGLAERTEDLDFDPDLVACAGPLERCNTHVKLRQPLECMRAGYPYGEITGDDGRTVKCANPFSICNSKVRGKRGSYAS